MAGGLPVDVTALPVAVLTMPLLYFMAALSRDVVALSKALLDPLAGSIEIGPLK